jgi:hypothetical protein
MIGTTFDGFDEAKIRSAHQQLVVVALASYNTGFDDEPRQNLEFCIKTEVERAGATAVVDCQPNTYLPTIKRMLHEQ